MPVVSTPEVKDWLSIDSTQTEFDTKLAQLVKTAQTRIGRRVGPLEPEVGKTVRLRGAPTLVVPQPIVSVASVTPYGGTAWTPADVNFDARSGVIDTLSGTAYACAGSSAWWTVVYTRGWVPLPEDLKHAVLEYVRELWAPKRGPVQRPGTQSSGRPSNSLPNAGSELPFSVQELIADYALPGFS